MRTPPHIALLASAAATTMMISSAAAMPSSPLLHPRAITCLTPGSSATATWTNSAGQTCSYTGTVGANFGTSPLNGGDYSCNGRCGAGCTGTALGDVYTADCWAHDVCSWFEGAEGGSSDPNCGAAYDAAVDDTIGGLAAGCGQDNPDYAVQVPAEPVCS